MDQDEWNQIKKSFFYFNKLRGQQIWIFLSNLSKILGKSVHGHAMTQ